jgi:CheY-like chemotaxis protein
MSDQMTSSDSRGRRRILIVDDNVEAAAALGEILEGAGHSVSVTSDPVAALDVARRLAPEIAILDIELPVMDGYELGQRLRDLPQMESCTLIAITGYGHEHNRQHSQAAGFQHHLVKPFDTEKLLRILSSTPAGVSQKP